MASVAIADLSERLRRGAGRYPQPVALLARLGVDERHEGQGLGAALLLDAITRVASLSEASLSDAIGCRGLLVHAESEQARGFDEHLIPEFRAHPPILCTCSCCSRTFAARWAHARVDRSMASNPTQPCPLPLSKLGSRLAGPGSLGCRQCSIGTSGKG